MEVKTNVTVIMTIEDKAIDTLAKHIAEQVSIALKPIIPPVITPIAPVTGSILRLSEIVMRIGLSRSTIYRRMSEGTFPHSIKLGERAVGWHYADIKSWEESRPS